MKNKVNKLICISLVFVLCTNIFAAVVSDNDGSAFITKSEFDSLKNNFQSQLDSYNSSIDSKIDGAIASYLSGIKMESTSNAQMDSTFKWTFPIICMNNSEWNDVTSKYYDYEMPYIKDVSIEMRGWENNAKASSWNSTSLLTVNGDNRSLSNVVCVCKAWNVMPDKYCELINIKDKYINRQIGGSTVKAYEIDGVGKGRHETIDYSVSGTRDAGHAGSTKYYWGYTGVMGIGVNGSSGNRSNLTTGTYSNWTSSTWTRTGGAGLSSSVGWGRQNARAFVLPNNGLNLDGARSWGASYTAGLDTFHAQANTFACANSSSRINSYSWKNNNNKTRQWIYTGNSDAPATSVYGWSFDMLKPRSATEPFEGYYMHYDNDIGMTQLTLSVWYYGFHAWTPRWFWRYKASGTIGTSPSSSEFSKLPSKQVYYHDNNNNIHFLDEGLFLFNLRDTATKVDFTAKWDKIDTSLPAGQKIILRISSDPFNSVHDHSKNLKYKVNTDKDYIADQQVSIGEVLKITVECKDDTKQLYMMWEPVTSGAYIGLSEISGFIVTKEAG